MRILHVVPTYLPAVRYGGPIFTVHGLRRLYWSPTLGQALHHAIGKIDIVHLHSVFLWPTWAAARAARRERVPYVLSPRGMLVKDLIARRSRLAKSAWIHLIERSNVERAAALHLTSQLEATEIERFGWRLPRLCVIPMLQTSSPKS